MQAQFVKSSTLSAVEMPLVEELRHRARQWGKRHARVTRGQWVDVVSVNGLTFDAWANQLDGKKRLPQVFEEVVFECYPRERLPEGLIEAMADGTLDRTLPWVRWTEEKIEAYEAEAILTAKDDEVTPVRYRILAKAVAAKETAPSGYVPPIERAKLLGRATYDKKDSLWDDSMDYVRPGFSASVKTQSRKVRLMAVERLTAPLRLLPINKFVTI